MSTKYTSDHEWLTLEGNLATIGITDFAQAQLGDLVFVELPQVGKRIVKGQPIAVVESVKAASDVYSPISGEVLEVNPAVVSNPAIVNQDPMNGGWFFKIRFKDAEELADLMSWEQYKVFIT
jgi:glycine cleavage system H protein